MPRKSRDLPLSEQYEEEMQEEPCITNMHTISGLLVGIAIKAEKKGKYRAATLALTQALSATLIAHCETMKLGALLQASERHHQNALGHPGRQRRKLDPFADDEATDEGASQ